MDSSHIVGITTNPNRHKATEVVEVSRSESGSQLVGMSYDLNQFTVFEDEAVRGGVRLLSR